jgi:hypothetical protein
VGREKVIRKKLAPVDQDYRGMQCHVTVEILENVVRCYHHVVALVAVQVKSVVPLRLKVVLILDEFLVSALMRRTRCD